MSFPDMTLTEFNRVLASKSSVPGGGGASALVGAVGIALGSMVGNLTAGKKKYAAFEEELSGIMKEAEALRNELLRLIDADAEAFEPLSRAYGIPKDVPDRQTIMEEALKKACSVPLEIMRAVCRAIDLHVTLAEKGSVLAISDVGVGVACCRAALTGASLNIFINTKSMTDREYAAKTEAEADAMLEKYCAIADDVFSSVYRGLRRED